MIFHDMIWYDMIWNLNINETLNTIYNEYLGIKQELLSNIYMETMYLSTSLITANTNFNNNSVIT